MESERGNRGMEEVYIRTERDDKKNKIKIKISG